ncbi:MAG: LysM peptidoglycan-binding domain-containing protein [Lachnospirales bacterium]
MYQFYLGEILLPISPNKVTITTGSQNRTYTLIDGEEINIPECQKLRIITFEALIPYQNYPFANYVYDYIDGDTYLEKIEALKKDNKVFQFVITRLRGQKTYHFTDIRAIIEEIKVIEESSNGFDLKIQLTLKEYREYGAKFLTNNNISTIRQQDNAPTVKGDYSVILGDSLWKIAKKYYGDGSKWKNIYEANKSIILDPNKLSVGMNLTIPEVN